MVEYHARGAVYADGKLTWADAPAAGAREKTIA